MPSAEHQQVVEMLRAMAAQRPEAPTVEDQRAGYELIASAFPVPEDVDVTPVIAGEVPCEWVAAPGADESVVVEYLHGGGYVIGSLNTHRELASRISRAAGARVLLVDYRLAPDHPHPAALEDALAAYRWLLQHDVDPGRVVVAGDSAGGGLTVATLVALRDAGDPLPAAAVCLSPWVDLVGTGASLTTRAEADPVVRRDMLEQMAAMYLGDVDARTPLASPLYADLSRLPPMLVQVGTAEVLLDDAVRLADGARTAGVDVELEQYEDLVHVFQQIAAAAPEAAEAVERIGAFIRRRVDHTSAVGRGSS